MSKNLPSVTSNIPRDLRNFVDRLRDIVGGTGGDKLISAQDLIGAGIANVNAAGTLIPNKTVFFGTPPAPTNVAASGAIKNIIVTWDSPDYPGHAHAEIWGASTDVLGTAVLLALTPGSIYSDPVGPSTVRYYWVRFVNVNNVTGPYNAVAGARGETGPEVAYLLGVLANQISTNELNTSLNTRINGIEVNATAITTETTARTTADTALAQSITTLTSSLGTTNSAIQTETTARTTADTALAQSITTLTSSLGTASTAISTEASARVNADNTINSKFTVKIDTGGHVSGFGLISTGNFDAPTSTFGVRANQFFIAPPATVQASAPTANLYVGYVWVDSSVTPNVTRYYNGSGWTTTPQALPFVVQASPTTIGGVDVPAGVYMDAAFIRNATITNAKIADATIDDAKITKLSVTKLDAGSLKVGSYIQSDNYVTGVQGFKVDATGTAEFASATIRGTVFATNGSFSGEVIAPGSGGNKARMYSGNFEIYKDVPSIGTVLYKALSRLETGVGQNNVQVTIPGYFTSQPKIIVSPANIKLYDTAFSNQSQSIQCEAQSISESSAGSMVWRFTPKATLSLAANTGQRVINEASGSLSTGWTSGEYTTSANTSAVTLNVTLRSSRGTGTSGNFFYRTVRWRAQYYNGGWVDSAYSTTNLGADASANVTTSITVTFPSAGAWTVRVITEAYDTNGTTFNTGTSYETAVDTATRTDDVNFAINGGPATVVDGTYVPSYSLPSGWSITGVSFAFHYSYSISSNPGTGGGGSALVSLPNVLKSVGTTYTIYGYQGLSESGNNVAGTYSRSTLAFPFYIQTTTAGGYASLTMLDITATISRRRPLTNSTTAANSFSLNYYNFSLSSSQVLAEGSLNWVAIGE